MTAGCVIIGRNEAARLPATFASVKAAAIPFVYVDSGSKDASVAIAEAAGAPVVNLDPARPFTAARARNDGLAALVGHHPDLSFVMFLDGDCLLDPAFVSKGVAAMNVNPDGAIVVGQLSEASPDTSIYARMCSVEWTAPVGPISDFNSFGGIMLVRISDFHRVGGFNATMIAGEDPEFAVRLALAGRTAVRIDAPMATHRADIVRFGQWWQRAVRGGHAMAHRYALHGTSRLQDCKRQYFSTIFWGGAVPALSVLFAPFTGGLSLLLLAGFGLLSARMTANYRRAGAKPLLAIQLAGFGILAKLANFIGVVRFFLHKSRGKTELLEYK
jgi:glycosyltransferase involved in cell wall biosynthesis